METTIAIPAAAAVLRTRTQAPTYVPLTLTDEVRRFSGGAGTSAPPGPQLKV